MSDKLVESVSGLNRRVDGTAVYFSFEQSVSQGSSDLEQSSIASWWYAGPRAYASECRWRIGGQPGYAIVIIPMTPDVRMELANQVACNPEGVGKQIFIGSRMAVKKRSSAVIDADGNVLLPAGQKTRFVGTVVDAEHVRDKKGKDKIVCLCYDDRHRINEFRLIGRYVANFTNAAPAAPTAVQFQQGWHQIFNPGGIGNAIFWGEFPAFAPHAGFGLSDGEQAPSPNVRSQTKSCVWTMEMILTYWSYWHVGDHYSGGHWPFLRNLPAGVSWDEKMGTLMDQEAVNNFNVATGQGNAMKAAARKGREMNAEGVGILDAVDALAQAAQRYRVGVDFEFSDDDNGAATFNSKITIVAGQYRGGGISLPVAVAGSAQENFGKAIITRMSYHENGENFASLVAGAGDKPFIEVRVDTLSGSLQQAWTAARLAALVTKGQTQPDAVGLNRAFQQYAEPLAMFKLNLGYDLYSGTPYSGYPRLNWTRPAWPRLLSFPDGLSTIGDYVAMAYPIRIEIHNGTDWQVADIELDALEVWDNGMIYIPGLRNIPNTSSTPQPRGSWRWTGTAFTGGITANHIRVSLAFPADHRLTRWWSLPNHVLQDDGFAGIRTDCPDLDRIAASYKRVKYLDLGKLYRHDIAASSYPIPQTLNGSAASKDIRNDTSYLDSHVSRELYNSARLSKEGSALWMDGYLVDSYRPGMPVLDFHRIGAADVDYPPWPVRGVIGEIVWHGDPRAISTEIRLT